MPPRVPEIESQTPALQAFLLGQVDFERILALQQRLLAEALDRDDGQITLLLCEHPTIVTIGRGGSAGELAPQSGLLRHRQVEVRWVNRGGGCLVHCPGQLAIYPLVPLRWHGFSVGDFLDRFHAGIVKTLADLNIRSSKFGRHGICGRTGQLAAFGVAVRHWITYYGGYLNVCPAMGLFRMVESDSPDQPPMSCLVAERRGPGKMPAVRAALVERLAECFGCDRYHLYTGHPLLRNVSRTG
jgi:lipoyl(octanoyl) transferase